MHKKKWYLLLAMLLMGALLLSSCGGDEEPAVDDEAGTVDEVEVEDIGAEDDIDSDTGEVTDEGEDVVEEPTPEEEVVEEEVVEEEAVEEEAEPEEVEEVTEPEPEEEAEELEEDLGQRPEGGILIWADDTRAPLLQELVPQFEEEFGIPVVVEQPATPRESFVIAAPAGEGPDLLVGAHDWIGQLVANGLLAPVELVEEDQFVDTAVQAFTYNGQLYGMPTNTENVAFFRNTELVPEAPETWEEVMQICEELGDQVDQCFPQREADPYHFYPIQTSFGGDVFGRTEEGAFDPNEVLIDSEGSVESAQFLAELRDAGYYEPGTDYDIYHTLFEEGNAAFIITGPWALERIQESGVPYGISSIPAGTEPGAPFLGAQGFMVNAFGEGQIEAQLFLTEFVATEEVMRQLAEGTNRASAFIPVLEDQISNEDVAGFTEAGETAIPMPAIPEMASVWDAWSNAQTLIIQGSEEADVAFQNAAEQIRTLIAEQ